MAKKKDERPIYGQVPLPQPTKTTVEVQQRKRELRQPPSLLSPLPKGQRYRMFKVAWGGLNKTNEIDTGQLSDASNIDMGELPYIVPCTLLQQYISGTETWYVDGQGGAKNTFRPYPYTIPRGLFAYENKLFVIYSATSEADKTPGIIAGMYIDVITQNATQATGDIHTGLLETGTDEYIHTVAPFNVYDDTYATIDGNTYRRLIIAPYMRAMNFDFEQEHSADGGNITHWKATPTAGDTGKIYPITTREDETLVRYWEAVRNPLGDGYVWAEISYDTASSTSPMYKRFFQAGEIINAPKPDYITSYGSRLFGVGNGRVMASEFGEYAGWTLDTSEEINEGNAWVSPAQSNTKASTDFTGITAFRNHVVCFKKDFIHEVYNTKNPFRLVDVYSEGTIDQRTIQDVNGSLFFVSETNVLVYTGGNPRIVGRELGIDKFVYAVSGTDDRRYYLFCKDAENNEHLYVYDTLTRAWGERSIDITPNLGCEKVIGFANNNRGLFMLGGDGRIYRISDKEYGEWIDTDDDGVVDTYTGINWWFESDFITRHNLTSSSTAVAMAYSNVNIKHLKSIQLLADVRDAADFKVFVLYDGEQYSQGMTPVYDSNGRTGRLTARIKLRNTAHYGFKLRVQGTGYVKLHEVELYVEDGGTPYLGTGDTAPDGSNWL